MDDRQRLRRGESGVGIFRSIGQRGQDQRIVDTFGKRTFAHRHRAERVFDRLDFDEREGENRQEDPESLGQRILPHRLVAFELAQLVARDAEVGNRFDQIPQGFYRVSGVCDGTAQGFVVGFPGVDRHLAQRLAFHNISFLIEKSPGSGRFLVEK